MRKFLFLALIVVNRSSWSPSLLMKPWNIQRIVTFVAGRLFLPCIILKMAVKSALAGKMTRKKSRQNHFIYILQSGDGRYYTGYTTDLDRRLKAHQSGSGAKFTRSFGAQKIIYHETFPDKSSALKREAEIKGWSREEKRELMEKK